LGKHEAKEHDSSDPNTRHTSDWSVHVCNEEMKRASARWCAGYSGTAMHTKKTIINHQEANEGYDAKLQFNGWPVV
jgi:hypothetical protein